ncbi:MAG: alkaline phosphatase family protein [Nannocystaceae bacterium]
MHRKKLEEIRRLWSRRRALQGIGALGLGASACKDDGGNGDGTTSGDGSSGDASTGGSSSGAGSSSGGSEAGSSGGDSSGDTGPVASDCEAPSDLGADALLAPVEHIVVLMMENRSFDHMFGSLALAEGRAIEGLSGREVNPDAMGNDVGVHALQDTVVEFDPPHGWDASHAQWNQGANDGFVTEYTADGAPVPDEVMGYLTRALAPVSYTLADNYALCERWFASVMGPTWPNRFYLHLATSGGMKTNDPISSLGLPSIFDRLDDAGVSNRYYSSNLPFVLVYGKTEGIGQIADFFDDAAAGTLPQFSIVDPVLTANGTIGNDDHPPADIAMGQAFIASIYQALAASPLWERTLLVITYDEHGGFFDHVPPPTTTDAMAEFEQLGFRVPAIVIGGMVKRGCAITTQFDHVSVAATATRKWSLEPLTDRVGATNDLSSCIDPAFLDAPQPPVALPMTVVRRPRIFDEAQRERGQIELARACAQLGHDDAAQRRAAAAAIDAVLTWGQRLGVVRVVDDD